VLGQARHADASATLREPSPKSQLERKLKSSVARMQKLRWGLRTSEWLSCWLGGVGCAVSVGNSPTTFRRLLPPPVASQAAPPSHGEAIPTRIAAMVTNIAVPA
jgi:hypothetical protein